MSTDGSGPIAAAPLPPTSTSSSHSSSAPPPADNNNFATFAVHQPYYADCASGGPPHQVVGSCVHLDRGDGEPVVVLLPAVAGAREGSPAPSPLPPPPVPPAHGRAKSGPSLLTLKRLRSIEMDSRRMCRISIFTLFALLLATFVGFLVILYTTVAYSAGPGGRWVSLHRPFPAARTAIGEHGTFRVTIAFPGKLPPAKREGASAEAAAPRVAAYYNPAAEYKVGALMQVADREGQPLLFKVLGRKRTPAFDLRDAAQFRRLPSLHLQPHWLHSYKNAEKDRLVPLERRIIPLNATNSVQLPCVDARTNLQRGAQSEHAVFNVYCRAAPLSASDARFVAQADSVAVWYRFHGFSAGTDAAARTAEDFDVFVGTVRPTTRASSEELRQLVEELTSKTKKIVT